MYLMKCEAFFSFSGLQDEWKWTYVNNWKRYLWNVHVTRDGGEVGRTIRWRKNGWMFIICSAMVDHQTACHLTTCNSSAIYWKKIATWRFWNRLFICKPQIVSRSSVHKIVYDVLSFWKLSSRWMPCLLTDEHIKNRMGPPYCLFFLSAYE